jgi:hypothetical protein
MQVARAPTCVEEIAEVSRPACPHALQRRPAVEWRPGVEARDLARHGLEVWVQPLEMLTAQSPPNVHRHLHLHFRYYSNFASDAYRRAAFGVPYSRMHSTF